MREIAVDVYRTSPTFSSAAAAIAHGMSYPPLAKAKSDATQVAGSHLIDASWTDHDFLIRFSNGRFLHVFVDPVEKRCDVKWKMSDGNPVSEGAARETVGSPAVLMSFRKSGSYKMDCSTMVAARRGREVTNFFVNEQGFYLYTLKQKILCFSSVYRSDNGENLLYVFEDT